MLVLLALTVSAAFGALGIWSRSERDPARPCRRSSPLLFFLIILSSMNLPRNLIETDWFRTVATINPVSYMIEGLRSLIIEGWNLQALALGFGISIVAFICGMSLSAFALRKRMART